MTGILALGLVHKNRRIGCYFAAAMLSTCTVLHAIFAVWSDRAGHLYQPMHVLGRAADSAGLGWRVSVAALLFGSVLWIVSRMKCSAPYWILGMYFAMVSLFIPEALKEFVHSPHFNWEASTYITFPIPLLLASLVLVKAQAHAEEPVLIQLRTDAARRLVPFSSARHA
jgi:hypothetical protein